MYIILVYDISNDENGAKRWRRIFKICKQYLHHIQNSVFEGDITMAKLEELRIKMNNEVHNDLDSVIIFRSRNSRWLDKEMIGIQEDKTSTFI